MATSEEIEKYCRNCVSRDFVNGKGLVCKRTRELPALEEEWKFIYRIVSVS